MAYTNSVLDAPSDTDIEFTIQQDGSLQEDTARKSLTLTFQNLTVNVKAAEEALGATLLSYVDPRQLLVPFMKDKTPSRSILRNVNGQISPGEMLLVLGRPGSGCTSLLRVLSNHRESFDSVEGHTWYGSMDHNEARKYRQQIMMNTEDDVHFPTLTVDETISFAVKNRTPREREDHVKDKRQFLSHTKEGVLGALGISHTANTKVGNEFIRGVSGGERKRVSLAEVLAGQSPVQFWDQPTRGLDSKTALEFIEFLRAEADQRRKTIVVTTYQASNGIFDKFDKVLVLASGCVIYYGPLNQSRRYFEALGFVCAKGANTADFLTSVTVLTERIIAAGFEGKVPSTAYEFEEAYQNSQIHRVMQDIQKPIHSLEKEVDHLKEAVRREKKARYYDKNRSVYTSGLVSQVLNCTVRQFQIMMGDRLSLNVKVLSAMVQALVCGSLFYNLSDTSKSTFLRPGVLFFAVLYFLMEAMSETTASFTGRPILARHKRFGFYRPTAFCIADALTDIPVVMLQITLFAMIIYFMSGLQMDAGKFFTYWVIVNASTLTFTQLFRMVGALCTNFGTASQLTGVLSTICFVYGGYLIPFEKMHPWFRWIFYLNPGAYAFESLMGNEYGGLKLKCVAPQMVPFGIMYDNLGSSFHGCTVAGSDADGIIDGLVYIREQYSYSEGHIWRGFGVLIGLWITFIAVTALGFEFRNGHNGSSVLLYKRTILDKSRPKDVEEAVTTVEKTYSAPPSQAVKQSVFCWHDLDYFVQYEGAQKQLLNKIFGYVQPGNLVALMGCSGAGKTTLLDVLAQRKDFGTINGSILIDGKPQGLSFQRMTGYCEQMDVHEDTSTVKEALVFSALLRQPREVPISEKLAYVEYIIDLLELRNFCDALIGVPGAGLSIEQRKRVTLGVELVAKPTLLFLDEPTSGLDGQSAYNIIRFLRRLVEGGQAVLCTIHQPSAVLFEAFDALLLLAKGGRMAYFGETGKDSSVVLDYFARNGAPAGADVNPADHIVEVIQGKGKDDVDWVATWSESAERKEALNTLNSLVARFDATATSENDTREFASTKWYQFTLVLERLMNQLWRSPDYIWNKIVLHVFAALFGGFTFWNIGNGTFDLQLRLFAIFNLIFVAPGCINQMQPFFLHNRDLFETREKKSKTYHWLAFIGAQIVSEIPYLVICATAYFGCWYFTVGFPVTAKTSGHIYLQMILYEFLYTSIGQAIAAYAPNVYFAAITNPLLIGCGLISFCGIVVPYASMQTFWKYWIYYLDPFNYLMGGLLAPVLWDVNVKCGKKELTTFNPPSGQTCGQYMADFLQSNAGYVNNASATSNCEYCPYQTGADYAKTFNLRKEYYGWRDTGITALFCLSSYALVIIMMKLRSKKTKSARSE
ncbi:ABC multidrug transporter [Grosmannia clavigera kw1407]|uniref:ABC multidrug transporter n=1 Tax=Grosmannia clavigera (strain kw1407 / UAMH 11150) TaxID=655863 RepID=F0XF84_GROCL|nr:ABC multidrug transporter [Grosmannia clavigera kw1407]EFX03933.1 ABC multidrug transporter [Grosmannia clavigera kw1407]